MVKTWQLLSATLLVHSILASTTQQNIEQNAVYATQLTFETSSPIIYTTTGICIGMILPSISSLASPVWLALTWSGLYRKCRVPLLGLKSYLYSPKSSKLACRERSEGPRQDSGPSAAITWHPDRRVCWLSKKSSICRDFCWWWSSVWFLSYQLHNWHKSR